MLSIEKLYNVKTIICHKDCADGVASAMILHDVLLPTTEVVFVQYNTPELASLKATEGMLFCDFCPPADRYQEFLAVGALVLDHHKSAQSIVEAFGENGVFADEKAEPGVSGALLAYRHVWEAFHEDMKAKNRQRWPNMETGWEHQRQVERFAVLAGIRDTWQRQSPDWLEACAQAEALRFWPTETLLKVALFGPDDLPGSRLDDLLRVGPTLLAKQAQKVEKAINSGYHFTSHGGRRVLMFQGVSATSDASEKLGEEVDLVVGFLYQCASEGLKVTYSMRSHTDFDCAKMAKEHGGGGHTSAAGFAHRFVSNAQNQGYMDPFYLFLIMLDVHEQGRQWGQ